MPKTGGRKREPLTTRECTRYTKFTSSHQSGQGLYLVIFRDHPAGTTLKARRTNPRSEFLADNSKSRPRHGGFWLLKTGPQAAGMNSATINL